MGDIKLFRVKSGSARELQAKSVAVEKSLQTLIETHLETFLGVRFLATEYSTGAKHGGRIDTLGIDENGCPVIIEYKRAVNENVINQGLFYLDWLLDHKAEFKLIVIEHFGARAAKEISWESPRLLCVAGDYKKYDEHAVQQINRNIELIRYRKYPEGMLLLELVNAATATGGPVAGGTGKGKTISDVLEQLDGDLLDQFEAVKAFLAALGDDVQVKTLKHYVAFKRIKNFACVEVHPQKHSILIYAKVDPESIRLERGFTRDVREIGHYGTGDLEIKIKDAEDIERAKQLLVQSYEAS